MTTIAVLSDQHCNIVCKMCFHFLRHQVFLYKISVGSLNLITYSTDLKLGKVSVLSRNNYFLSRRMKAIFLTADVLTHLSINNCCKKQAWL